ncbi:Importin-7 [Geodia barretti]|uniref:Importin-7 n=1 Tax=Geodia barretti TaxID=519541 RepID=A0AA35SG76_GEOBA|nr:Importin-7 [Geodia barretti]
MENTMFNMIAAILQNGVMDFYEEMLSLMDLFTTSSVSPQMWQLLPIIYDTFCRDGFDFFSEMMGVIYNYVRVDTDVFLSNPKHLEIVVTMCKKVLTTGCGEDVQTNACKLLEVVVIQCQGRIDAYIPSIMEVCLERLTRESKTVDMRRMCLQVQCSFYCNSIQLWGSGDHTDSRQSKPITQSVLQTVDQRCWPL